MNIILIFTFCLILGLYGSLNFYIGLKGWKITKASFAFVNPVIYWTLFCIISLSYFLGRFSSNIFPKAIVVIIELIGSYWLGALVYFSIFMLIINLTLITDKLFGFLPSKFKQSSFKILIGRIVVLSTCVILIIGTWSAKNPHTVSYDIKIDKQTNINKLHAVAVSDVHMGTLINKKFLDKMVSMINERNPDIVFIAGDLIDEDLDSVLSENMVKSLSSIKSKYGVYYCTGNHEYYGGRLNQLIEVLDKSRINVLMDQYVKVADSFYIIGREDKASASYNKAPRKSLKEITKGLDTSLPLILLDHQPSHFDEASEQGIDLQISGHTHKGQLFPVNFITNAIFKNDWGYYRNGDFQSIVSAGFGTWGPPIRVLNRSEIVDIIISFESSK